MSCDPEIFWESFNFRVCLGRELRQARERLSVTNWALIEIKNRQSHYRQNPQGSWFYKRAPTTTDLESRPPTSTPTHLHHISPCACSPPEPYLQGVRLSSRDLCLSSSDVPTPRPASPPSRRTPDTGPIPSISPSTRTRRARSPTRTAP